MTTKRTQFPIDGKLPSNIGKFALSSIFSVSLIATAVNAAAQSKEGYNITLEEVVVTAQQRVETSMTTPVTVNAFTAQDLVNTGALSIQDIGDFMPGVEIGESSPTQTGITIRGVSSPNISTGGDPSVATFYDGAYVPRSATTIPFSDLARTEVLKGPQGTLFGRNATAGVISIIPNAPSTEEFEGYLKARLGNFNLQRYEAMVNYPVSDNFAIRANLLTSNRDGIVDNIGVGPDPGDEGVTTGRISALWHVSDATSLQFSVDVEDRDEAPRTTIGVGPYAYKGTLDPFISKVQNDVVGAEETREMQGYSIKLNHEISDEWSLYAISSYRDWETTNLEDEDGTSDLRRYFDTNNIEESDIFYNEARFNFVTDKIDLIVGANYSQQDLFQRTDTHTTADSYMQFLTPVLGPEFGLGNLDLNDHLWDFLGNDDKTYLTYSGLAGIALLPPSMSGELVTETIDNSGEFTNWGVFADVTYQLTDTLRLAAGLRYSYDEKEYSWKTFPSEVMWPVAPLVVTYDPSVTGVAPENYYDKFTRNDDWSKVTGRAVVDWQFSENAMTYFSIATGYKSGGFDGQAFEAVLVDAFAPEEVTNYELGIKGDFFDNSLRLEAALFYMELDNRQDTRDAKQDPSDLTSQPTVISGDEETEGVEIIATWSVTDDLRIQASGTYREKEAVFEQYFDGNGDIKGGDSENSKADNDYTIRVDWTPNIPVGYLLVHVDYVYDEDNGLNDDTTFFVRGPYYFQNQKLLSARVAWMNDDDTLEVALWGKNLLDNNYASNPGGFVAGPLAAAHTNIDDPITYGIDVRYSF